MDIEEEHKYDSRYAHTACLYKNRYMVTLGGINNSEQTLN